MRNAKWIVALVALMAMGLIAAGCGDDDDTTAASDTSATESSTSAESTTSDESTTSEDSGGDATSDDVLQACEDVIKGTPAESAGETACQQAADAFDQCQQQAEATPEGDSRDLAIQACQDAANQAVDALQAAG
jgi:hypothetical protein